MQAAWPLGVDILEWKKAKAFYKAHRDELDSFLGPAEAAFVHRSPKPFESLAMILSAKEAVFKALGLSWMGNSGFSHIRILPGKKVFSFRLTGNFKNKLTQKTPLGISFTKNRRHVVATCHPRERALCAGI